MTPSNCFTYLPIFGMSVFLILVIVLAILWWLFSNEVTHQACTRDYHYCCNLSSYPTGQLVHNHLLNAKELCVSAMETACWIGNSLQKQMCFSSGEHALPPLHRRTTLALCSPSSLHSDPSQDYRWCLMAADTFFWVTVLLSQYDWSSHAILLRPLKPMFNIFYFFNL